MWILKSLHGDHMNWSSTSFNFFNKGMISQTSWGWSMINILTNHCFSMFIPFRFILFTISILSICFKMKKVCANRTIAIFKTSKHDSIFHLSHFCTNLNWECISGTTTPRSIPSSSHSFTN